MGPAMNSTGQSFDTNPLLKTGEVNPLKASNRVLSDVQSDHNYLKNKEFSDVLDQQQDVEKISASQKSNDAGSNSLTAGMASPASDKSLPSSIDQPVDSHQSGNALPEMTEGLPQSINGTDTGAKGAVLPHLSGGIFATATTDMAAEGVADTGIRNGLNKQQAVAIDNTVAGLQSSEGSVGVGLTDPLLAGQITAANNASSSLVESEHNLATKGALSGASSQAVLANSSTVNRGLPTTVDGLGSQLSEADRGAGAPISGSVTASGIANTQLSSGSLGKNLEAAGSDLSTGAQSIAIAGATTKASALDGNGVFASGTATNVSSDGAAALVTSQSASAEAFRQILAKASSAERSATDQLAPGGLVNTTAMVAQVEVPSAYRTSETALNTAITVPVAKPGWTEAVMQRVMWMSSQNINRAEIALDPPELGPMQVRISTQGDQTTVAFSSNASAVRDALDQSLPRLREMMEDQGLDLSDANVSDNNAQSNQGEQQDDSDSVSSLLDSSENPEQLAEMPSTADTRPLLLVDHYV